ncbi:putative nicotinate-nucleotide adenylyltransferase [Mycoplasmopsis columbina SF7]|uniref:Probable nicotinate-nucleotide adenylyltransferase n=1 Tax=Mycoplasmopsis columbina SF7 TaxID=1037410 RepID=F9UJX1_9BACT|nr:nicotinate-nucleotide adenylyltransferase [Mycoplasmopsis columbina]EGV00317.1 putative nicotinate-nucleotide adenylyltransferase [Mycoplasmopsis columbina SF7]
MKIALFGGSFNPIHNGHLKIAKEAIKQLNLDKLIFVPAAKNPFKKKEAIASNEDRLKMLELALEKEEKMEISLFELKRGGVSYTFETIRYFKRKFPQDELFFIMGSDLLPKLNKWEHIDEISQSCKLVAFRRSKEINKINAKKYNVQILKNELQEESSTAVRSGVFDYVPLEVNKYIGANFLYAKEILHNTLKKYPELANHCVKTAEFAVQLAKSIKYDAKSAYYAGLFHDIAKKVSKENSREFLSNFLTKDEMNNVHDYQLHQLMGHYWLKHEYKITNQAVLRAIKVHTGMDLEMYTLDKILFIADKICEGRRFKGVQKLRELCLTNFDEGFKEVVKINHQFNLDKGVVFTPEAIEIYKKWMS